jgi:PAS domain S-box-containing protein
MLTNWNVPFRTLLDAAPDGMVICDAQGVLVLANSQAERMFGYARDELPGQPVQILIPQRAWVRHQTHVAGYAAAPRIRPMGSNLDLHGVRKDGSLFPVEISLSPCTTERGTLIIAGIRDVTERFELERDKARAMSYLVSAVEAVQESFLLFDEHDRVRMINSAARELIGETSDAAILGRSFEDLLRTTLAAGTYDLEGLSPEAWYERRLAYHRTPVGALELRTRRGRHVRVTERKTAEHGTVMTIADITEDVLRAAELRHARAQAEAASAAKSEFLASMSHELRTPLNAVLGFAQLLQRDRKEPLSPRHLERIDHVLRGGEHLLRLIEDVLDLSRIEARRISVSAEPVGVAEILGEIAETLQPMAARAQIAVSLAEVPDPGLRVLADRTRLAQILMNFGSNAIKYGREGGHLELRAEPSVGTVRFAAIDDGIGIPDEHRGQIFEPFQRAGQEAGAIEGTGIGLTISKRLATLMHGDIGFDSAPGRGSTFWVELPRYREPTRVARAARPTEC